MSAVLKAESREAKTKSEAKQLRAKGQIPGVVYGTKVSSTAISVNGKELLALLRENPHAVVDLELPADGKQPVMVQEVQRDKLTGSILHIDLHQINMNEPIQTAIGIAITGEAPGVKEGGILTVEMHELEIKCLPGDLPGSLTVDISKLGVGENLLVSDIAIPDKVELLSNPDDVVVTVLAPQKAEEPADKPAEEAKADEPKAKAEDKAAE